jgi:NAD(P)-dependent dehydrogenase (short-subunit alcohol dehydrogenase family)
MSDQNPRVADSLEGEIAIVTGGSRGIGRAVVEVFVAHGASVVFCDLDADLGHSVAREVGDRAKFVAADVSVESDVAAVAQACTAAFGPASILVNNAGVNANFDATTMTGDDWDRFMGVDLKSAWLGAKYVLPHMREVGRGAIVNVASMHALATLEGFFPYAAAKSGLVGMTRSLALDFGPYGIRVNAVAPGYIRTRLVQDSIDRNADPEAAERSMVAGIALRRIGKPVEIANVIRFLASEDASYITGTTIHIDGGVTARRAG